MAEVRDEESERAKELRELKTLRDDGVIDESLFKEKSRQVLGYGGYPELLAEISIGEMKSLVNDGVVTDSEFTQWISASACQFACDGDLAALSLALDEGADPNFELLFDNNDFAGEISPLIYAAKKGHEQCVARLLEAGADPNSGAPGISALCFAVWDGHARCVERLLAAGANPSYRNFGLGHRTLHHTILDSRAGADGASFVTYTQHILIAVAASDPGQSHRHVRDGIIPLFYHCSLSAGASIPQDDYWLWRGYQDYYNDPRGCAGERYSRSNIKGFEYLDAVHAAGGLAAYARAHRSIFVAIFSRGTRLPTDVLPTIVEYWAHLGWYQYRVPAAVAGAGLDDRLDDDMDDVHASSSDDESTTVP